MASETFEIILEDVVTPAANSASNSLHNLASTLGGLAGSVSSVPIGSLAEEFGGLVGPVTMAVTGLIGAAAALGAVTIAGAEMAIKASEMKEQLVQSFGALLGGVDKGEAMVATLDRLSGKLGMTREELAPMAQQLLAMGVPADQLEGHLRALAGIKAIGLPGGPEAYLKILNKLDQGVKLSNKDFLSLRNTGVNVDQMMKKLGASSLKDLEAKMKSGKITAQQFRDTLQQLATEKSADAMAAKANSLGFAFDKLKGDVMKLFEEIGKTEGYQAFVSAFKVLASIFDANTTKGKALRTIINNMFSAIFSVAAKVLPWIKAAFLGLVIAGIKIYNALKPAIAAFKQLFSSGDSKPADLMNAIAASAELIIPPLVRGAEAAFHVAKGFVKAYQFISQVLTAIQSKIENVMGEVSSIMGGGGSAAGGSFIDGIVGGITGKAGAVYSAIKNMASTAVSTLMGAFQAHSPSKLTEQIGGFAALGVAKGIEGGAPKVGNAWDSAMGEIGPPKGGGDTTSNKSVTINVGGINLHGAEGQTAMELTEEAVALVFERLALSQGL